eukprot:366577-Chlamydomonas_euryale.AAC.27
MKPESSLLGKFPRVCVMLQLWTVQPPPAEWIRWGQPAHTPTPQRPPGANWRNGKCSAHKPRLAAKQPSSTCVSAGMSAAKDWGCSA